MRKNSDNNDKKKSSGLVTGLIVGSAVGSALSLVFATKKGRDTSKKISKEALEKGKGAVGGFFRRKK